MKRIPELDGVRGLAAIGVVLFHAFPNVFFIGWSCVDLFFVLSGYLITTIIVSRPWKDGFLKEFYLRRVCRIWPVYFLTLVAVMILNSLSPRGFSADAWPYHALFLQNTSWYFLIPPSEFIPSFGPSWSVAIEEQFYLFWPLLLLRLRRTSVPWLAFGLLSACALVRWLIPESINILLTRGDGLGWGCLLGWLLWQQANGKAIGLTKLTIRSTAALGGLFVALYVLAHWGNPHPQWRYFVFSGFGMLFFALIGTCVLYTGNPFLALFRNPLLRWFGTISYAMYLFHIPIFHFTPAFLDRLHIESSTIQFLATWLWIVTLPAFSC